MNFPRALIFIIAAAVLVRLFLFGMVLGHFGEDGFFLGDSRGFQQTAVNILEGRGFSRDAEAPFRPSAFFPPLYPLLLAGSLALSHSVIPLILLQIVLSSLMPLLVWKIAQEFTDRKSVGYIAAGLTALEPLGMLWSITVLTDVVAVFFLILAAYLFLKLLQNNSGKTAAYAGFALGFSALTRPEPQYLFLVAVLFLIVVALAKKMPRRAALAFPVAFLVLFSPWLARNYAQFGNIQGTTTGIRNIYTSLAVSVETYRTGQPYHEVRDELLHSLAERNGVEPQELFENPAFGPTLTKEGVKILLAHPSATAATFAITINSFFTQDLYTTYLRHFGVIPHFPIEFSPSVVLLKEGPLSLASRVWNAMGTIVVIPVLGRLFWIALTLFSIAGAFGAIKKGGRTRLAGIVLASVILIYAAGSQVAGFSDHGRHRYPVNAFIFLLASYGIARIRNPYPAKLGTKCLA